MTVNLKGQSRRAAAVQYLQGVFAVLLASVIKGGLQPSRDSEGFPGGPDLALQLETCD